MTTIGTAVLQIIPSLLGVTEEIEKQLPKTPIEVKVAPKVDPAAAKKAGKDAGDAIVKETKESVRKGDIGKSVSDEVTKSVKKSSPGKDLAKVIVDGLAEGAKGEMRDGGVAEVIVDGLAEGIKQGIDGDKIGGQVVDVIGGGIKRGNLGGAIKDAVLPSISQIGDQLRDGATQWSQSIANSLRSGDIQGATDEIGNTIRTTTDTIATIGEKFGLQLDGVKKFGDGTATTLQTVGGDIQEILTKATSVKSSFADTGDLLENVLPGKAGRGAKSIISSLGLIIPVADSVYAALNGAPRGPNEGPNFGLQGNLAVGGGLIGAEVAGVPGAVVGATLGAAAAPVIDLANPPGPSQNGVLPTAPNTSNVPTVGGIPIPGLMVDPNKIPRRGAGGQISGPGTSTSDSILAWLSTDEFVVNADATRKSLPLLEAINAGKIPGFAGGGLVAGDQQLRKIIMDKFGVTDVGGYRPADKYGEHSTGRALDVMVGGDKSKGDSIKDFALANAKAIDLKWAIWRQHLYYPGGGGYDMPDRGSPTQNHMDHVHIFSGPGITNGLLGSLAGGPGAAVVPGGPGAEDTSASDQTASSIASAVMSTVPAGGGGGGASVSSSSGGGGVSLPTTISGLATAPFDAMTRAGQANSGPGHRDPAAYFPEAASAAIGGQVDSVLGAFGINGAPHFLEAASTLLGGISVGGHDPSGKSDGSLFNGSNLSFGGGSAAPSSAASSFSGTPPPDNDPHGTRAGQAPGPTVNYNIRTATVEDAFVKAQRIQNEKSAAKTAHL